jgi:hypothetical protein
MGKYLIVGADDFDLATARLVTAETAGNALDTYMRTVESRNPVFREHVLDLCVNMTFVEQFHLSSGQEKERFTASGEVGTEDALIKSRVRRFFIARPDIGERFIAYMDTEDSSLIDDSVFEFIALHDMGWRNSFRAIDLQSIDEI